MADIPFTVFSFLAFFLCIPPAYFNYKLAYRPWATLILIGWIAIFNLCLCVDSIIWASPDVETWWPGYGWCDIDARLKDMFVIGVPGSAVGICRFLADAINPDPGQKDLQFHRMRRNMIDLFLGVGLPLIIQAFKFIGEVSRYHIAGVDGCAGTIEYAWPALFLYPIWAPILCLVAGGYSCIPPSPESRLIIVLFIRHWWVRRKRMNELWESGMRNGISKGDFRRLMITILCVVFVYVPLSLYSLAGFLMAPKVPFDLSRIHGPLWKIILLEPRPKALWSSWIGVFLAFTSFILLGFTQNAKQAYFRCIEWGYDHTPKRLQNRLGYMGRISANAKERRKMAKPGTSFEM